VGRPERSLAHVLALAVADFAAVNLAFAAAYGLRYQAELGGAINRFNFVPYRDYAPWGVSLALIFLAVCWLEGLYALRRRPTLLESVYSITAGAVISVAVLTILIFGVRPTAQSRLMLPYAAVLIVALGGLVRLVEDALRRYRRRRGNGWVRTLIVGAGEAGRAVMGSIVARPDLGYHVVGFLDDDPAKRAETIGRFGPLGGTADLARSLQEQAVDMVILALPWQCRDTIVRLVDECEARRVAVRIVPDLLQMSLNQVDVDSLNGIPLMAVRPPVIRGWHYRLKRAMDVLLATTGLILLAPVMAVMALAIRLESAGPILYRQQRVGRDGRLFTLVKFRSMVDGADEARDLLRDHNEASGPLFKMRHDPRLTRVGWVMRRLSLDELPQLWNILRGDMSLVGPRPPMPCEVVAYKAWHRRRLEIAPGLTGLWQVSGRSDLTFDEMVMLDLFYAENWSLGLDLKILLRTVPTVLMGTGAY
jgi:exopolysaccharide biosynthesis polyprenyl glycosylphosphotransferase